ncbi:MAG: S41 family peptidase, partial [Steroidobacteraceae bacterium]
MGIAVRTGFAGAALCVLAACGGGGGGSSTPLNPGNPGGGGTYTPGVFPARATLAGQCTAFNEKMFLRSWTNDFYLWFAEVPDTNPNTIADVIQYFDALKTPQLTASMQPKDRFHFDIDTAEWIALSQNGQSIGYGAELMIIGDGRPPRRAVVAFVEPGTPASNANVTRGMEIVRVNNIDFVNDNTQAGVAILNDAFSPSSAGQTFTFVFRPPTGPDLTAQLTSANITHKPVLLDQTIPQDADSVGYLVFNDHIATAEDALFDAITRLQGVDDLILDIRYNGGGFLDIASELSYMISGRTGTFESLVFNSKNPNRNPVLDRPLTPTPIHTTTQD